MFWKGAFPGISFEIDPRFVADNPEFDSDKFKNAIDEYADGLTRYLRLVGVSAKSLAPQVADPAAHVMVQIQAIAMNYGIPLRVFMGSEEGRLASSQDKVTWNQRLGRKLNSFTEPSLIRNTLDRFVALGIMRPPQKRYKVGWNDLNTVADEDRANLALKYTQALSQYVASGVFHFVDPLNYMTMFLRIKPDDALRIDKYIKTQGGWEMLKKVDPSQSSAENGVRKNTVSKGSKEGTSGERDTERNSNDKKIEGSSS